ncbi:unnamed protein product, partial [Haemonchus placei]|uniref:Peptidase A2 domain-containing protein n=1 Tax=Haemonchus placei TaxID=6290 RepID=A0A0N4VT36_HAEPC
MREERPPGSDVLKNPRTGQKVSRQVHWCEEPAGSSDSGEELVTQSVNKVAASRLTHYRRARPRKVTRNDVRRVEDSPETGRGSSTARLETGTRKVKCRNGEVIAADMVGDVEVDRLSGEQPRMLEMEVNGKKIPFELDTGASLSIIDEKTWKSGMVHKVKQMPNIEIKREIVRILDNNKRLFQDDLGKCSTARAELKFKSDVVVPKFFR